MASLAEYVVVAHDRRLIEIWRRADDGAWSREALGPGEAVTLRSVACSFTVDELYDEAGVAP